MSRAWLFLLTWTFCCCCCCLAHSTNLTGAFEGFKLQAGSQSILSFEDLLWSSRRPRSASSGRNEPPINESTAEVDSSDERMFHVQVTAIHIERAEFPLSSLLFKLTLRLAIDALKTRLEQRRIRLLLSIRSANTCSRQFAAAVAAEEYYKSRARLFIVSGCDDAIRGVSRLASQWRVPVMTAAGFGADLSNKRIHRTLIRVAFSLKSAVDFLMKILRSYKWRRINLIVDESDPNSLALKRSIEEHLAAAAAAPDESAATASGASHNGSTAESFQVKLNAILLDLHSLTNQSGNEAAFTASGGHNNTEGNERKVLDQADKWPNEATDLVVRDALRQSSLFSRVNILLIPQSYLRKFMLSVYDLNMANGLYTFINMPLLLIAEEEQQAVAPSSNASTTKQSSYIASTGENVFIWRSPKSPRNSQAKKAYESLMSIYLRSPTAKAYVYFQSKLLSLANTDYATTTTETSALAISESGFKDTRGLKIQLSINPYSASFYDCLQIYAQGLEESLDKLQSSHLQEVKPGDLHAGISDLVKRKRFNNMVTGTIQLNENGDRETDFTLNDLNQMTGTFYPVILYRGDKHDIERLSRIHWSSDETVGPTVDNVDCRLSNTCASKPWSKFLVTLMLLGLPLALFMSLLLYCVYKSISLESQLVDYWWKISAKDIEFVTTRRKIGGESVSDGGLVAGSQVESSHDQSQLMLASNKRQGDACSSIAIPVIKVAKSGFTSEIDRTVVTKATGTSTGINSTALDVCYGEISLGIYKLNKVAVKPITKFHQSRKLMIELRTMKSIEHSNLCRFIGIVVDEGCQALVSEFCPKGSLREFFQNESMVIDWTFKYSIINDITAGLNYLQSSDLEFHGRLKSSNCLVSSRFVVKLSDFGLETLHEHLDDDEDDTVLMKKQIWRAPEHMKCSKRGSKKGDIYSLGLLLYEITTNRLPFYDSDNEDYVMPLKILFNELKTHGPTATTGPNTSAIETQNPEGKDLNSLVELMQRCWTFDPNKRPSLLVVSAALKKITHGVTSKKLLENLTSRMEQYTNNLESLVDAKLAALLEEKQKTEELLYQFVPKTIASRLKEGETVEPEAFDCVTVLFSDIVGFTSLSSESTPIEVIDFLSDLYLCFDETLQQYDIFKVDTIGDAYIVASGLPQRNEGKHVLEIAQTALELRDRLANFKIPHKPGRSLEMRVGINSGPCIAGIVGGLKMPKYCVFGDTLTTGKFMESSGQSMKIHITDESKRLLERIGGFKIEPRAPRITKDGLPFQTYWLERL